MARRGSRTSRKQVKEANNILKKSQYEENARLAVLEWMAEAAAYDRAESVRKARFEKWLEEQRLEAERIKGSSRPLTKKERREQYLRRQANRPAKVEKQPVDRSCIQVTGLPVVWNGNNSGAGVYRAEDGPDGSIVYTRVGHVLPNEEQMRQEIYDLRYQFHLRHQLASKVNGVPREQFLAEAAAKQAERQVVPLSPVSSGKRLAEETKAGSADAFGEGVLVENKTV